MNNMPKLFWHYNDRWIFYDEDVLLLVKNLMLKISLGVFNWGIWIIPWTQFTIIATLNLDDPIEQLLLICVAVASNLFDGADEPVFEPQQPAHIILANIPSRTSDQTSDYFGWSGNSSGLSGILYDQADAVINAY